MDRTTGDTGRSGPIRKKGEAAGESGIAAPIARSNRKVTSERLRKTGIAKGNLIALGLPSVALPPEAALSDRARRVVAADRARRIEPGQVDPAGPRRRPCAAAPGSSLFRNQARSGTMRP